MPRTPSFFTISSRLPIIRLPCRSGQRGRRRGSRVAADGDSEDNGDEEYVAGEDEDEYDEEEEEFDDDDEEEFQFSDSSSGDGGDGGSDEEEEADFDDDEDDDDDDDEEVDLVQVSRSKRRRSAGNSRNCATKFRASYSLRKEEVHDPLVEALRSKSPKVATGSKRSVRKPRVWDDQIEVEENEEVQNDFVDLPRSKLRRAAAVPKRSSRKSRVSDDENDEDEDDSKRKKKIGIRSRKDVDEDEDYKEDLEEEFDDEEDLTLDELDEDDISLISPKKHVQKGNGKKRKKSTCSNQKNARKRRKVRLEEEDYDDDFCVKKDHPGDRKKKNSKKIKNNTKRNLTSRTNRKKSPVVDSETSDFNYVTSDDDFEVKDWNLLDEQRNRIKNERRKPSDLAGSGRKRSSIGSDTSSSDSDFEISEEELRDLGIGGVLNRPQPKRVFAEKKGEQKGKEKVSDEAGKQVCGICLSEEQRTTVQGILNCCIHYFCYACITEWSKVESRCPLCKRRFGTITKSSRSYPGFGQRKSVIKVEKRDQVYQPSDEDIRRILDPYENVVCMECQQGGDDSLMLLCDICDSSAHTYCAGLGREVPEGNWYCECCRSVADISSNATNQASINDDGPSNGTFQNHGMEREENKREASVTPTPQQPIPLAGQPSLRGIDLNVSPRPEEDYGMLSQASGGVAATVSGRRAIRQHMRLRFFFPPRVNQTSAENDLAQHNAESGIINPGAEQGEQSLHDSVSAQHNDRSSFQSNSILAPCHEGSFRCEEGAKARVYSIVKCHLEDSSTGSQLEHSTFKKIARRSTHTILAAYGIKHKKKLAIGSFRPPSGCSHISEDLTPFFIQGCCSSCFTSFVANVVSDVLFKASQR